ncbi:hypothetical protein MVEN_01834000 [Mycena venus]|uniref:MYND-type domain-containing protein n=1 Tax=Mycena venus TaxID=2733690 RepID=A0A8H7CP69_9AGAR|nr:hypothetical protein MVEN_01834000 [Mycena venus]
MAPGGTLTDVARLVVSFIDGIVPEDESAMFTTHVHFLRVVLIFVGNVDPTLGDPSRAAITLGQFGEALLSQDIIRALISALCSLSNTTVPPTVDGLHKCLNMLAMIFITPSGYHALPAALDDGLLRALVMCAQCSFAHEIHDQFKVYFIGLFRSSLVHYRFLSALDMALDETTELINTRAFKRCGIYKMWEEWLSVVDERLKVLHEFDSQRDLRMKACDNLKCSTIDDKTAFRRCSGCRSFYYCSIECQTVDWRSGGHREACKSYGKLFLSEKNEDDFGPRQRSFFTLASAT